MEKIRLGISSCLLGEKVRYDGGHKLDHFLKDTLGQFVDWVPVCPEVEAGLPIPREAMRLTGSPEQPRLVTRKTGLDHTGLMQAWSRGRLKDLEREDLCGFIFKSRSPSSGMKGVKVYDAVGTPHASGVGIFARAFMEHFPLIPVEDEGRLNDPSLRDNFIERVFVFNRGRVFLQGKSGLHDLVEFHAAHKLLLLAHSPRHYTEMGRLVAGAIKLRPEALHTEYFRMLMEGMTLLATVRKNTNVLQHIAGYFKKRLSADERQELVAVIGDYHKGLVPLIVPVVLLRHYVRKYDDPYLKRQHYLAPHPAELMLRNHV
ncbi:MAG: YbgA family protein [Thermodesulfovibrionales bacterium]